MGHAEDRALAKSLEGKLDLNDTEDTDHTISYAPAVTHETIKPHVHEIKEERIHREVHTHDVYHRFQPIYEFEVLPARHFVPGNDGELKEVSERDLPGCTGVNQRWHINERTPQAGPWPARDPPDLVTAKFAGPEKSMTSQGVERTHSTVVHPPTLADISKIAGPVLPVHFDKHGQGRVMPVRHQEAEADNKQAPVPTLRKRKSSEDLASRLLNEVVPPRKPVPSHKPS